MLGPGRIPALRRSVQAGFTLFSLYAGYRFYLFYLWATGASDHYVQSPPAVEGFLPISALLGLKRLVLTGRWDPIHPAGLTIFLAALAIALLCRKGFCGWICPVGFISNSIEGIGRRFRLLRILPRWLDYPLLSLKYLLLFFFCYLILWKMNLQQVEAFQRSPYNLVAAGKMLLFFLAPGALSAIIMLFLVLVSFVVRNFWCRYLCPYGALLGLLAFFSPCKVKRDPATCIDCKKCERQCPGAIRIAEKKTVRSAECVGCMECIAVCPQENCLTLAAAADRRLPVQLLPAAVLALFFLFWAGALATGHWQSAVPPETLRSYYKMILSLAHP